jgi:hypothetical protein
MARDIPIQPDPVPASITILLLWRFNLLIKSTMISVSGLGMRTLESTKKLFPKKEDFSRI